MSLTIVFWGLIAFNSICYIFSISYQGQRHQDTLDRIDELERSLKKAISDSGS